MVDSRTRRMESENNFWLLEIGLVIIDESHVLCLPSRGHAVESGLMRFTSLNKLARIILLSATMPNVDQLGAWLRKLNQKETKVVFSKWRPVQLQMFYKEYRIERTRFGGESYQATQEAKRKITVEILKSKPDEKFLIFVHDKGMGRSIVSRLKAEGIESLFHNADLDSGDRIEIESSFTKKEGGLRVLVSTSTLAYGRNLPARNVIIVGVHRGLQEVDELDIIQESGRAGRYGIDDSGFVYLIIPEGTTETWKEVFRNPRPVMSVLKTHQILAFHVLAEIQNKVVTDAKSLLGWYSRSLAYFQGEDFTIEDAKGLLDDLEKMDMVINKGTHYILTGLGKVSGWLYYSPYDVYHWHKNWNQLFGTPKTNDVCPVCKLPNIITEPRVCCGYCGWSYTKPLVDDISISWALTDIPSNDWGYIPKEINDLAEEMKWKLRNRGILASDAIHFSIAAHKLLNGEELEGVLKAHGRTIKYDIQRIVQALKLIDSMHGRWGKDDFWKILPIRISYGIPESMIELVSLPGIGGVKARKLFDKGVHSLQDIIEKTEVLKSMFVPTFVKKLQNDARKIITTGGR
jgi:replicative superfamily II helicase